MRQLGETLEKELAERLKHALSAIQIEASIRESSSGTYSIWVIDENLMSSASVLYHDFIANPNKQHYIGLAKEGQKQLEKASKEAKKGTRNRIKVSQYSISVQLIALCSLVFLFDQLIRPNFFVRLFSFSNDVFAGQLGLGATEIVRGQIWRLFTPVLLHENWLHIFFNMYWLWEIGNFVESTLKKWQYIALLLFIAVPSNVAFFLLVGPNFLGMSGVIYGLVTYLWAVNRFSPNFVFGYQSQYIEFFTGWYIFCLFLTLVGMEAMANTVHSVGAAMGFIAAFVQTKRYKLMRLKDLTDKQILLQLAAALILIFSGAVADYFKS